MNKVYLWIGQRLKRYSSLQKEKLATLHQELDIDNYCRERQIVWGRLFVILCIFLLTIPGVIYYISNRSAYLSGDYAIQREMDHGQEKKLILTVSADRLPKEEVQISVRNQLMTGKYREELFKDGYNYVISKLKGDNDSLDCICRELDFVDSVPGSLMRVTWDVSQSKYIMDNGVLNNEKTDSKGVWDKLSFCLIYGASSKTYDLDLRIYPPLKSDEELLIEKVYSEIEKQNEDFENNTDLILPSQIDGTRLYWAEKKDITGVYIAFLSIIIFLILFFRENEAINDGMKKRQLELEMDYPEIVHRLILFLDAGMNMKMAIETMVDEEQNHSGQMHFVFRELKIAIQTMNQGISEVYAYEDFGRRCGSIAYIKLASLMIQWIRKGSKGMKDMMNALADEALLVKREDIRKRGEILSTKLLMPMGLMLIVVIAVLIVPAFMTINI